MQIRTISVTKGFNFSKNFSSIRSEVGMTADLEPGEDVAQAYMGLNGLVAAILDEQAADIDPRLAVFAEVSETS